MLPIRFQPLYKQRVWGGRSLHTLYKRELPTEEEPYGEAWELVDRGDDQSVVVAGEYEGLSLQELWSSHREEVFGLNLPESERFPLLIKILDCQKDLSLQVHPPEQKAAQLGGEAKSEMWHPTSIICLS